MTPEALFQSAIRFALAGWLLLLVGPLAPILTNRIAGMVIPGLMSVGYTAIVLAFWSGAPGGFDTLANVMALFYRSLDRTCGLSALPGLRSVPWRLGRAQGPDRGDTAPADDSGSGFDILVRPGGFSAVSRLVLHLAPGCAATRLKVTSCTRSPWPCPVLN